MFIDIFKKKCASLNAARFVTGWLLVILIISTVWVSAPIKPAQAQSGSLPAQINKSFTPISIVAGNVSRLSVTIFNPNAFGLINAAWTDTLPVGITLANPVNATTTCGGTVSAVAGGTSIALSGGTTPSQVGATPGSCTVEVDVTSITPGNLINTIPAGGLTSTSPTGVAVTNTTPASATLQVRAVQPPSLNKNFSPNTIWTGETSTLTINVVNNDLVNALTEARLTDTLPSGLTLANPVSPTLTNCGGASLTADSGASTIGLSNATIAANTTCRIQVRVTASVQGTYTNTIPAGAIQTRQGGTNTAAASANLAVQSIGLLKDFQAASIPQGGSTPLTITLRNPSGTAYTGVHLADTLPGGLVIAASPAPVNNCGGVLTATSGTNLIELTGGTIPASLTPPALSTCTLVVPVTAPVSTTTGTLTNTIPVGAMTTTEGLSNPTAASDTLGIAAALTVAKSFSPATITVGSPTTVTITLRNYTKAALTGVSFTDTLPNGLTVFGTPTASQCNGGTVTSTPNSVTLTGGSIPTSANPPTTYSSCAITFQVTGAPSGSYTNTVPVGAVTADSGYQNMTAASTTLTVSNSALPVNSSKSFNPTTITAGGNTRLRIDVVAPADSSLNNVSITDVLPAGMTVSNSTAPAISNCGASRNFTAPTGATTISLTNGTILAGQTCRIDVYVTSNTPGAAVNAIPSANITYNENRPLNTPPSATLTVTSLTVSKAFYPPTVNPNGRSRLTITLMNNVLSRLVNAAVTDSLTTMGGSAPVSGVYIAATPNAVSTCGGTLTATPGSQIITLTDGIIPAQVGSVPGICTISLDVEGRGGVATRTNTILATNISGTVEGTPTTIHPAANATAPLTIGNLHIVVNKAFDPLTVFGGSASTMSIELRNPDSAPLTGIAFSDGMPTGMIIANPANFDTGACGGALSGAPGASAITYSGGTLPAASACTLTMSVTMLANGNLTNSIPAGAVTTYNGVSNTQSADASLTNLPGASISKFFSPASIPAGLDQYSLLTITIRNTSTFSLTGMGLVDNLPAGLMVAGAGAPAPVSNCGGALTAVAGTQDIQLSGGTLAGDGSCTLVVPVNGTIPGNFTNAIPSSSLTNNEGATNTSPATDTLTLTAQPALNVTKTNTTSAGPITIGTTLTFDIEVKNTGNVSLTNVTVTDPVATLGTCSPTQPAALAPGASMTCPASHVVTLSDMDNGAYTNTAAADSDKTPEDSDAVTVPLSQHPALDVTKSVTTPGPFTLGDSIPFSIVVANSGDVTLTGVTVADPDATLETCSPAQPATLVPGASMTCTASHAVTQTDVDDGSFTNTAAADSDQTPPGSDDAVVSITRAPGITLDKTGSLDPGADGVATPGDVITYTFTVANTGNVTLTNVTVSDPLIAILGGPIASLAPGDSDSTTFTGSYTITQDDINHGTFTNVATASGTQPGGGDISETDDDTQTLTAKPLPGLAKNLVGAPQQVSPGVWDVTFDLTVKNYGNVPLTQLQVTDNLANTFPLPTTFTVQSLTSSDLTVNWPGYNGNSDINLLSGVDKLDVGGSGALRLVARVTPATAGPFGNSAIASGKTPGGDTATDKSQNDADPDPDHDGNPGNNETPTPVDFGANLFRPPYGVKSVSETGENLLRWTVVWMNSANHAAVNAQANDSIPEGTTFVNNGAPSGYPLPTSAPAGSLASGVTCSDTSTQTTTQNCYYEGPTAAYPRGQIVWRGMLGSDYGATDAATAANEITISFTVRVDGGVTRVANTASIDSDLNGDGDALDTGEQKVASTSETWTRPVSDVKQLPETGFRPGVVSVLPAQPANQLYTPLTLRLEIQALGVDIPVVGVPQSGENWDVTWLGNNAGWLNGTAYPTWNGNSALTGHVWDADNKPGPFASLRKLKYGDQIRIHAFGDVYIYEVRENRLLRPDQASAALKHEEKPWLTLLTCENYSETLDTYASRRMVRAVLVRVAAGK